ncbi:hypothetical protein [Streptomyces stelliscabiei]|uniref:hypothetical protein n=1 Tax=Streptomyces stelliscabiei TaxID=146820 RepID=UPI002FF0D885
MSTRTFSRPALQLSGTDPTDTVALWAEARTLYLAEDFPPYGSPSWFALHPDDPKRFASVIAAAEKWRKYGDEEGLIRWFREASAVREPLAYRRTRAELDEAWRGVRERAADMWARERARITPNPRWPKVAVPGQENRT